MSTNNKVFQVLVTNNNVALLAKDQALEALADGQLGIFDADTNKSIDGTSKVRAFYFALAEGTGEDRTYRFSAAQEIQLKHLTGLSAQDYTPGVNMKFELTGIDAKCDTDYGIKLEFRNSKIYARQGYNQFAKTYNITTACCDSCEPCPAGSKAEVAGKLFKEILLDEDKLLKVALSYEVTDEEDETSTVTLTTLEEVEEFMADEANKDVEVKLEFEVNSLAVNRDSNIQMGYNNLRGVVVVPSLIEGFRCKGKVTVTQEAKAEEGKGVDIKQKEYFAGGWEGKPGVYRASTVVGLEIDGFDYQADSKANYHQVHLVYDQFSTAGWGEYLNNMMTIFAIPAAHTTTKNSLVTYLNRFAALEGLQQI